MSLPMIPYGRQWIEEDDVAAVVDVLRGDWLTTGPTVAAFEQAFAQAVGAKEAVAVNSGTAALHAAMAVLGIQPGDEVIVPALTFAATANAVVYCGGTPVFADVDPRTLCVDPEQITRLVTPKTKAMAAVDYAGLLCDYDRLGQVAQAFGLKIVADACHALGARSGAGDAHADADLSTFSFHPVKHIATGEGGMITTANTEWARIMRSFRNHGITTDHRQREAAGSWFYEMTLLGFNYRLTDFQCALGMSQLKKLPRWVARRHAIATQYQQAFADLETLELQANPGPMERHAYHLFVVLLRLDRLKADRQTIFKELRDQGIGVNVHYVPVYWHPYYRQRFGHDKGLCPHAEAAYERLLTLPMYPKLTDAEVERVIVTVRQVLRRHAR